MSRQRKRILTACAVPALTLLLAASAPAQTAQQACAADIKANCAGVQQGEGRIAQCLRSHSQQLSPGCKRELFEAKKAM